MQVLIIVYFTAFQFLSYTRDDWRNFFVFAFYSKTSCDVSIHMCYTEYHYSDSKLFLFLENSMNLNKKRIICVGHVCLDITPVFDADHSSTDLENILVPGRLTKIGNAVIHTGGSVSNTGLAMKVLGANVSLLGKVGDDAFGRIISDIFAEYGASGLIVDSDSSTSYSVVLAVPGSDRIILHNSGANDCFYSKDIPDEAFDRVSLMHFGYPPLMKSVYDNGAHELVELFKRAKNHGVLTSLDMAMTDAGAENSKIDWRRILKSVLPFVDYYVPSFEETASMLGYSGYSMDRLDFERDVRPLAGELRDMGASVVMIKCGAAGLYCASDSGEIIQPAYSVEKVRSAIGAGDTCIAAFLLAVLSGKSLEDSVRLAAAEGACCVTTYDALSGLLPLDELENRIASGWPTV